MVRRTREHDVDKGMFLYYEKIDAYNFVEVWMRNGFKYSYPCQGPVPVPRRNPQTGMIERHANYSHEKLFEGNNLLINAYFSLKAYNRMTDDIRNSLKKAEEAFTKIDTEELKSIINVSSVVHELNESARYTEEIVRNQIVADQLNTGLEIIFSKINKVRDSM